MLRSSHSEVRCNIPFIWLLLTDIVIPAAMPNRVASSEDNETAAEDPRCEVLERVLASPSFAKSDRLCQLLKFICELSLQGRDDEINEVNIGARLFGRANYDPAVDGIVRSHASRLRQRLDQYFNAEGADEPLRITIPKGTYVPVFEPRPIVVQADPVTPAEAAPLPEHAPAAPMSRTSKILGTALVVACAAILYLLFLLHRANTAQADLLAAHPLWASFFGAGRQSLVVCSDTSLAVLQDMSGHDVNLSDYANANYRMRIGASQSASHGVLQDLAARRYTAIADVGILTRFYGLPGIHPDRIAFRYARDVLPNELKQGSAVLIGSAYSDPWVSLFEPRMNFAFRSDPQKHVTSVVNRAPLPGEKPRYDYSVADGSHTVYGVVALRPNLEASGKILLLEGTSMAGTEAAADFVFDDHLLRPFLDKISGRDGRLPYFEVLLESVNMNGSASQIKIVSYRTSND